MTHIELHSPKLNIHLLYTDACLSASTMDVRFSIIPARKKDSWNWKENGTGMKRLFLLIARPLFAHKITKARSWSHIVTGEMSRQIKTQKDREVQWILMFGSSHSARPECIMTGEWGLLQWNTSSLRDWHIGNHLKFRNINWAAWQKICCGLCETSVLFKMVYYNIGLTCYCDNNFILK